MWLEHMKYDHITTSQIYDMITAIDLLGLWVGYKKMCARLVRETKFILSAVISDSQVLKLVR